MPYIDHGHHRQGKVGKGDDPRASRSRLDPFNMPSQDARITTAEDDALDRLGVAIVDAYSKPPTDFGRFVTLATCMPVQKCRRAASPGTMTSIDIEHQPAGGLKGWHKAVLETGTFVMRVEQTEIAL
ncbi:MAG: hypothetical protein ACN6I5_08305 [Hyphomicrobiales bacterium]